jgi:predicted nucleic acid-binding protein
MLAPEHHVIIPDVVRHELEIAGPSQIHLPLILQQNWIRTRAVDSMEELAALGRYTARLVGADGRNLGECGVLALAEVHGWTAIIDDAEACRAAKDVPGRPVDVRRTLGLLCEAVREGHLTEEMISELADDLAASNYRVPFAPGGFIEWAKQKRQLG